MEKKLFVFFASLLALTASCNQGGESSNTADSTHTMALTSDSGTDGGGTDSFCTFIPKDSANKMISSYLGSINYPGNDSDLYSIIIDVKKLQDYLNATSSTGSKATKIKLMFAHSLDYINSGGKDHNCGYQSGKLTLVLATYDSAGNYIYAPGNKVLEHLQPCPTNCPTIGTAANNLLQ